MIDFWQYIQLLAKKNKVFFIVSIWNTVYIIGREIPAWS